MTCDEGSQAMTRQGWSWLTGWAALWVAYVIWEWRKKSKLRHRGGQRKIATEKGTGAKDSVLVYRSGPPSGRANETKGFPEHGDKNGAPKK
jgi:hypothetical protein